MARMTKADIIDALMTRGQEFASWLETLTDAQLGEQVTFPAGLQPPSKSRFEMLLGAKEHEMHHRGQLMVIQRLLGVTPERVAGDGAVLGQAHRAPLQLDVYDPAEDEEKRTRSLPAQAARWRRLPPLEPRG